MYEVRSPHIVCEAEVEAADSKEEEEDAVFNSTASPLMVVDYMATNMIGRIVFTTRRVEITRVNLLQCI